jgi:hypothetical protein
MQAYQKVEAKTFKTVFLAVKVIVNRLSATWVPDRTSSYQIVPARKIEKYKTLSVQVRTCPVLGYKNSLYFTFVLKRTDAAGKQRYFFNSP